MSHRVIPERPRVGGVYDFAGLDCLTCLDVKLGNGRGVDLLVNGDSPRFDDDPVELRNTKILKENSLTLEKFPPTKVIKFGRIIFNTQDW